MTRVQDPFVVYWERVPDKTVCIICGGKMIPRRGDAQVCPTCKTRLSGWGKKE